MKRETRVKDTVHSADQRIEGLTTFSPTVLVVVDARGNARYMCTRICNKNMELCQEDDVVINACP